MFDDIVNSPDCTALNVRAMIDNKLGAVKELVVALLLLSYQHLSEGTEERHEEFSLVIPHVGRELNVRP